MPYSTEVKRIAESLGISESSVLLRITRLAEMVEKMKTLDMAITRGPPALDIAEAKALGLLDMPADRLYELRGRV